MYLPYGSPAMWREADLTPKEGPAVEAGNTGMRDPVYLAETMWN